MQYFWWFKGFLVKMPVRAIVISDLNLSIHNAGVGGSSPPVATMNSKAYNCFYNVGLFYCAQFCALKKRVPIKSGPYTDITKL